MHLLLYNHGNKSKNKGYTITLIDLILVCHMQMPFFYKKIIPEYKIIQIDEQTHNCNWTSILIGSI